MPLIMLASVHRTPQIVNQSGEDVGDLPDFGS